jgi:hypothetical protein
MELSTIEHVLLARAALATGNPDALEALVRAALATDRPLAERARAVLLAEGKARGLVANGPEEAPVTLDDYRSLVTRLAADPGATVEGAPPRWLEMAARLRATRERTAAASAGVTRERA